ncbi:DUF3290 family protein [Leuconostoc citreum]|uniref:DUF3290 family protein n=1 Tax=Leuconostoc citreum TaxID=33964 RepID=UPI00024658DD|nr:DUF3290 family protein [Leuconostoc citreum]MCS8587591.1 DUF3290 domain-containing protein [Leuconostoc citreum]MCS8594416.1 DUF3290 domain-containing protein [Leuconostoc citreum]MCS8599389.1 DUF3290 domain-containing protein [Leuconostoc citreum]CCF24644.1 Putative uncharacterized protein [Leuconostoc citreum LBAE C10]CCF26952.1 Putative uncharacterized protein [Leuconostoc citreum LBAE C11]
MNFYSVNFLSQNANLNDTIVIYTMVVVFGLMAVGAVASLRNRYNTKYRDLSIIALLLFLFLAGARYTDYEQAKSNDTQVTQMPSFAQKVAETQHVSKHDLYFNQKTINDGMIVKIKDKFFRMTISPDQQSYTLTRTYITAKEINYIK